MLLPFLEVVESEAFGTLHHVKIINLTRNSIKQIQMGAFGYLPLLTTLDLSYISLTTIPGEDSYDQTFKIVTETCVFGRKCMELLM